MPNRDENSHVQCLRRKFEALAEEQSHSQIHHHPTLPSPTVTSPSVRPKSSIFQWKERNSHSHDSATNSIQSRDSGISSSDSTVIDGSINEKIVEEDQRYGKIQP